VKRALYVSVCRSCGRKVFPPRALCPACGGASWTREPAEQGVVEEVTTVRRAVGAAGEPSVVIASIRLDAGPVIVAGLDGQAAPGDRVDLSAADGAPVGNLTLRP